MDYSCPCPALLTRIYGATELLLCNIANAQNACDRLRIGHASHITPRALRPPNSVVQLSSAHACDASAKHQRCVAITVTRAPSRANACRDCRADAASTAGHDGVAIPSNHGSGTCLSRRLLA